MPELCCLSVLVGVFGEKCLGVAALTWSNLNRFQTGGSSMLALARGERTPPPRSQPYQEDGLFYQGAI